MNLLGNPVQRASAAAEVFNAQRKCQLKDDCTHGNLPSLVPPLSADGFYKCQLSSKPSRLEQRKLVPPSDIVMVGYADQHDAAQNIFQHRVHKYSDFQLSKLTADTIRQRLETKLLREEVIISTKLKQLGFLRSRSTPGLDSTAQRTLTNLIRRRSLDVASAARLVRGETEEDPRPNKALIPSAISQLLQGYKHRNLLLSIVLHGIEPKWTHNSVKACVVQNHKSCQKHLKSVLRSIREGQDNGRYLLVDDSMLEQWPNIVCSPLGAVEKKGIDPSLEVRTIHDLSFPDGQSTNSCFDKSCAPEITYQYVIVIADRIEDLSRRYPNAVIRMLKGDVKGAYRHLMTAAAHVHWMGARIPEENALIIDLSAPFGWSGSPPFYAVFGRAITRLVQQNSPVTISSSHDAEPFWGFAWVDDHLLIEPERDDRLELAEAALRHAMMAILGPRSINEDKFSSWETRLNALGLTWDTVSRTVSMPTDKITKALDRVRKIAAKDSTTKSDLMKLLGSLRHVCSCLRTARPFYQRLQMLANKASRFGKINISTGARIDLSWFEQILTVGKLQELPLSIFGSRAPEPHVHIYMDASNLGIAVLNPSVNEYVQIRYDSEEHAWIDAPPKGNNFSINVREHFCIALAIWIWGPSWSSLHNQTTIIKCCSDNQSDVAWSNTRASSNEYGEEINRAIGLGEAVHNIRVEASHLPGASNIAADAASQAWIIGHFVKIQVLNNMDSMGQMLGFSIWLPPQPALHSYRLALFGVHCWKYGWNVEQRGNTASAVITKISHISWHHRRVLGYPVGLSDGHKLAVNGMRRQDPETTRKLPVTVNLLRVMHKSLDLSQTRDRVIWGATVLGVFLLLRRSEYLAVGRTVYKFILTRTDISFLAKDGKPCSRFENIYEVVVRFRGGKNDQFGQGTKRSVGRSGQPWLCPIHACWFLVQHHSQLQISDQKPLCTISPASVVQVRDIANLIKSAAASIGANPQAFGTHSLRSSGATALFAAGTDNVAVKQFGRWKSGAFERYIRLSSAQTLGMANTMANPV